MVLAGYTKIGESNLATKKLVQSIELAYEIRFRHQVVDFQAYTSPALERLVQ